MRVLLDTNIILDITLKRKPFVESSTSLLQALQEKNDEIFLSATTITDLYYILRKGKGKEIALSLIKNLLEFVEIASVDKNAILQALESDITDFEDAVQENSAKNENITVIITRNERDFKNSELEIYTPESYLEKP